MIAQCASRTASDKVAFPLNLMVTWPYRRNCIISITDFNDRESGNMFRAWLKDHYLDGAIDQGHLHMLMAEKQWKHFECSQAMNSAHIAGLCAAVGTLDCKLRNVYLVNLDGDYVFTEVWLNQCLERAMVECQSLPADWCDEVCDIVHRVGEPPLRAKVGGFLRPRGFHRSRTDV